MKMENKGHYIVLKQNELLFENAFLYFILCDSFQNYYV